MEKKHSSLHEVANAIYNEYIDSGKLKPGDKLPGVRELQSEYSTSATTIVHALSVLQQQGVIRKNHGVGCFVLGRREKNDPVEPSNTIGLIVQIQNEEIIMRLYSGVERGRQRYGSTLQIADARQDYNSEYQEVKKMIESRCGAIILYPAIRTREQLEHDYLNNEFADFPIILVDTALPKHKRSKVIFDNYYAGYEITQFLINEGHRNIAFMLASAANDDLLITPNLDRYRGYLEALKSSDIQHSSDNEWVVDKYGIFADEAFLRNILDKWKQNPNRPTAVIAVEDYVATGLTHAALDMGISVPDELRIVGFDDLICGRSCRPLFPTTSPDFARAGELAMELAVEQASGRITEPVTYLLPVPLNLRNS